MGENGLLEKVKSAITTNSTVKGLMNDFKDIGIKVNNELETVIVAEDYWIKINNMERGALENYKVSELKELPATIIKNNGIEYRIHGILHNGPEKRLSPNSLSFIKGSALNFSNPEEKEECLYEPGMANTFGRKNVTEINTDHFFPYLLKTSLYLRFNTGKIEKDIKSLAKAFRSLLIKNDGKLAETAIKIREHISYLALARELFRRRQFPMPLELEKERLKRNLYIAIADKERDLSECFSLPDVSKEYAKSIKKITENKKLKILHFITGLSHESGIAYYLQNS